MKKVAITLMVLGLLFIGLHSTPKMALRTEVLLMGYPVAAFTSEIIDYDYQNVPLEEKGYGGYVFSKPPIEKATQGYLDTYQVKKVGFLYFAEFIKDI